MDSSSSQLVAGATAEGNWTSPKVHSTVEDFDEAGMLFASDKGEHAFEIFDGGAEAFQKRKDKYRI
ncbi:MAG: hypothetical protein CVT60_04520 [Actinobacteria bacterium HGW-Actinobacteria-10]|jgi:hypothetical protein|nr:MAG: hypothetical protein CVT60_04520 [Actinobacteria bacterium HGW-Actinobacteria-10]